MSDKPLSVSEVCEVPVNGWVNGGFSAVVAEIKQQTSKKTGKPFWPCLLRDSAGSSTVEMTVFTVPKFVVGDQIDVLGTGIKRGEYNGNPQVSIGKGVTVQVVGKSVHAAEQQHRASTGEPALNGTLQPVPGQSVGMALKEALALNVAKGGFVPNSPDFWLDVHTTASDIIRLSRLLESGKLAPSVKDRATGSPRPIIAPPPPPKPPAPTRELLDEDVPF